VPADQKEEEKSIQDPPESRRGGFTWVIAITILVAVGIWFWAGRGSGSSAQANGTPRVKSTLHLETFVLNLADADHRSYLRIGIDLGLNQEEKRGEESASVAEVRDTILGVLAESKVDELLTASGKTKLKVALLSALQERIPQLGVEQVFFTEFLIQR
jgi:flagellar basal body-associated protein FliL